MTLDEAFARALRGPDGPTGQRGDPSPHAPRTERPKRSRTFRADIQGLRALAVVAVVLNHLTGWPGGGFLGVDVFFVISGYLITGLLLREHAKTRRVSLLGFYKRRIRRLLPAALTVTALTLVAAHEIFSTARFKSVESDGIWATVFWANWHFIHTGTDYFTASGPISPFQHYWSLSVEEQFYLVWPWLLFASLALQRLFAGRKVGEVRGLALCVAALVTGATFAYSMHDSANNAIHAYFSSFGRAWELGLGAVLALARLRPMWSRYACTALSIAGLGATLAAFEVVGSADRLPAPAALLACTGAAAVICAGDLGSAANPPLTNRVAVYVGDISYSIYLTHFPIIVFLEALIPEKGGYFYASALLLSAAASIALYTLVERPVLDSRWLLLSGAGGAREKGDRPDRAALGVAMLAALACITAGLTVYAAQPGTHSADQSVIAALDREASSSESPDAAQLPPQQRQLSTAINHALHAAAWPTLVPSIDQVLSGPKAPAALLPCGAITAPGKSECIFGSPSAGHLAVVVGDSLAMAYSVAYKQFVTSASNWRVEVLGAYGCPFVSITVYNESKSWEQECDARNSDVVAIVKKVRPDVLLLTNRAGYSYDVNRKRLTDAQWAAAERAELRKMAGYVGKMAIVLPPPWSKDINTCYTRLSVPTDCVSIPSLTWSTRYNSEKHLAAAIHAAFIDPKPWFCDTQGLCPAFVGTTPTKQDLEHPSTAYMNKIWPVMLESFRAAGLFH